MSRINNMTYDVFFVNQETVVTQDTKLYSQEYVVNNNAYDYVFLVNTGNTNSINELFSTRTYVQNYSDPNRYDIDLTTNQQFTNMLFGVSITGDGNGTITMGSAICATGSFDNQTRRLPHRMLEVMAHKIFGHAQARAAIANDAAFETLIGALSNGLNNSINQMRNDIFNQYITYDRIERIANGLNNVVTYNDDEVQTFFNFDNAEFDCPVRLVGRLNGGGAEMGLLNNGPDVLGNRVINGEYSIPMLVRFRRANAGIPVPNIAYQQNNYTLLRNVAMTNLAPTNTGGPALSWSVSPALPTGVSFNTATGVISGTPSGLAATTVYTVTALGVNGPGSFDITITVNERPPAIAYGASSYSFFRGTAITALTPTNSAGPINSFALTGTLPAGMSFNAATGVISGTPSVTMASASYSVTATGLGGTSTASFTIVVNERAPIVSYSASSYTFATGTAISALTPTNTGGLINSYSVSPALPAGLSLNTSTGIITGTPSNIVATASYNVTATGAGGSSTVTISITVNSGRNFVNITPDVKPDGVTPLNVGGGDQFYKFTFNSGVNNSIGIFAKTDSYASEETLIGLYAQGSQVNHFANSNNIGSINGATMMFNPNTGIISFLTTNSTNNSTTPDFNILNLLQNTTYSLIVKTIFNDGGADKQIALENGATAIPLTYVDHSAPFNAFSPPSVTYNATYSYGINNYIGISPAAGGATFTYSISPSLPNTLTLNTSTGQITGSINVVGSTSYTVTATHSGGSIQNTFTLVIMPTMNYPAYNLLYPINTTTSIEPQTSGVILTSYTITPALPTGFTFNNVTGAITGTPTATSSIAYYTVSALYDTTPLSAYIAITATTSFDQFITINSINTANRTISYTVNQNPLGYVSPTIAFGNDNSAAGTILNTVGTNTVTLSKNITISRLTNINKFVKLTYSVNGVDANVSNILTFTENIADPVSVLNITSVDVDNKIVKFIPTVTLGQTSVQVTYTDNQFAWYHGGPQSYNLVSGTEYTFNITINPGNLSVGMVQRLCIINSNFEFLGIVSPSTNVISVPAFAYAGAANNIYEINQPLSLTPNAYGATFTSFTAGSLPTGLSIDATTGIISGTPTVSGNVFYNIMGTYSGGTVNTNVAFNIKPFTPAVNHSDFNLNIGQNTGVQPFKEFGAFTSFEITPALPQGFRYSKTTGTIWGLATVMQPPTTYTITGNYIGGSVSSTFKITIFGSNTVSVGTNIVVPTDSAIGLPLDRTGSEGAMKAIDGNIDTKFFSDANASTYNGRYGLRLTVANNTSPVTQVGFVTGNDSSDRDPLTFNLEGSNDGTNWSNIVTNGMTNVGTARKTAYYSTPFTNATAYSNYRITFPRLRSGEFTWPGQFFQIGEIQLRSTN